MSLNLQQVKQLFDDMSLLSCAPSSAVPPCIPFMYPFNGCWARAHDMCRRMLAQGITPQKVWIHGSLTVKSANSSNCTVNWGWHVAPIVDVDLGNGAQSYVIDPSIFDEPVPQAVWASVQGDPNPTLNVTPWTMYVYNWVSYVPTNYPAYNQPDPDLEQDLTTHRNLLHNESPPPPYAVCQADVYVRDNLQDTGVTPLANGGISMSPDVNHYQQQLVDPQETLGTPAAKAQDTLFEPIRRGQTNYIYIRLQNRGNAAAAAHVDLYYTLPSTLPTPASWTLIGSLATPSIVPTEFRVVGPISWTTVPQAGHYCFVAVLGTSADPKPNINSIQNINDFYNLIRQSNNATWKNFDIIKAKGGKKIKIPFWIQGWPKREYHGDLEIRLGRLPKGVKVQLQVAPYLREGAKLKRMRKTQGTGRLAHFLVTPTATSALRHIRLKPGLRSQANLLITLPPDVRPGAYDIAVLQKIKGKEVGRVTRRLAIAQEGRAAGREEK